MTGLVTILVVYGLLCLAKKILSSTGRFLKPTGSYIKRRVISAIVQSTGVSEDAANAIWPLLVIVVVAVVVLSII